MSIIDKLDKRESWEEFLSYKKKSGNLYAGEERRLTEFILNEEYLPVVEAIRAKKPFPLPRVTELNKKNSAKKRKVFVFDEAENFVLKLISYFLGDYDYLFCDNLYSFRRNIGVKKAVADLTKRRGISNCYSYKVDIHNYFNSANTDVAVSLMKNALSNDCELANFLEGVLREPYSLWEGQRLTEEKGIMAGMPVSGFLANLYLTALDRQFFDEGIIYARYSDDIIVFAQTAEQIAEYEKRIKDFFALRGLQVNERKEFRTRPREGWEFLGFEVRGRAVDISQTSLCKIKAKLRRKRRALERWKTRKNAEPARAIRAFINFFNKKFYDNPVHNEITWCRWFFPTITGADKLRQIDKYAVECIRSLATGKHNKANFNLRYDEIRSYGYKSLVNAFYRYKAANAD